mmetsp:Transcript_14130/g.32888  ORF Transcript_14130/g.32888 Transcript_14130/m.32888 type:complete len:377 (+) Transcript_14130:103-1233(+)|eukprot:CAMPEP_0197177714 /NCGR_PEP_ID=MMETSP1423-20130617/3228_1 /TAXON_ID=476441 /ORGANISM="Pseudo-nitzschia heimii, Strain UNC1101" /LENGTH=376 /DNA_ID=CAMNT_0042627311 /DNA_START=41 /DNA_END=1171 /DNA_ORIENTATION=+
MSADNDRHDVHDKSVPELIRDGQWDVVKEYYKAHPEKIKGHVDPTNGSTILHAVCAIASTPVDVIEMVADAWPEALMIQENRYGATLLHLMCWTVQTHSKRFEALLKRYRKPEDVLLRNKLLGSTVLHSACGGHADLSVIKVIVQKYPPVLLAKSNNQHTVFHALWHSHLQSIPAHMNIARILRGHEVDVNDKLFSKFLDKMNFLAVETFRLSPLCPNPKETREEINSKYIMHGLLDLNAPLDAILVALKLRPELASVADKDGNYPLHHAVARRPFRIKYTTLLRELCLAHPEATVRRNSKGEAPVHTAIRERMAWDDGLGELLAREYCDAQLALFDPETGLYPFLLCASLGGKVAVNNVFCMLVAKPDLVRLATE